MRATSSVQTLLKASIASASVYRMPVARERIVPVELAEAATEIDMLLAGDLLIAKQQDPVIEKRAVYLPERAFAHRAGLRAG